jgi:heat shock protein HtpX
MKRILLFVVTNLAVMLVLGIAASLLGVNRYLTANGLNLGAAGLCAIMGFGGAIISLLMSKPMAKWSTGVQIINGSPTRPTAGSSAPCARLCREGRHRHARGRHLRGRAQRLCHRRVQELGAGGGVHRAAAEHDREEVEAVIGHEVAHVANGDMVTMTLIQGVMNTFVVFLSRVIGYFVDKVVLRNENDGPGIGYYVTTIVLDIVLGVLAAIIVAWFSRQREYRADAGAAS